MCFFAHGGMCVTVSMSQVLMFIYLQCKPLQLRLIIVIIILWVRVSLCQRFWPPAVQPRKPRACCLSVCVNVCVWKLKIMASPLSSLLLSLLNFIYGITSRFLSAIRHYMECKTHFIWQMKLYYIILYYCITLSYN